MLCVERGFQRLQGDASLTLTQLIGNSILAFIIASVFYDLPDGTQSFYGRGALLFFAILMNAFASALEVFQRSAKSEEMLTQLDIDPLCTTTDRRETFPIRAVPSVCRGSSISTLRHALQDHQCNHIQFDHLLHDKPPADTWRLLHLLPLLFCDDPDNVDALPDDCFVFTDSSTSSDTRLPPHVGSGHLHRLRRASNGDETMVPMDQLHQPYRVRL